MQHIFSFHSTHLRETLAAMEQGAAPGVGVGGKGFGCFVAPAVLSRATVWYCWATRTSASFSRLGFPGLVPV